MGLTGVAFASSNAVFHALQNKKGKWLLHSRFSSPSQALVPVSLEGEDPPD